MLNSKNYVGKPINFRGLVYAPVEENGVIFLFSKLTQDLGIHVETIRKGFPDCIAKRYIGEGRYEPVYIEFEFCSSDFKRHGHLEEMKKGVQCDVIVCWEHDWKDCPNDIQIIELKNVIKNCHNEDADYAEKIITSKKHELADLLKDSNRKELYEKINEIILSMDKNISRKILSQSIVYYYSKRYFIEIYIYKNQITIYLFTAGGSMNGVQPVIRKSGDGKLYGILLAHDEKDLEDIKSIFKETFDRVKEATTKNQKTGWSD
jgi:predicted transport protein